MLLSPSSMRRAAAPVGRGAAPAAFRPSPAPRRAGTARDRAVLRRSLPVPSQDVIAADDSARLEEMKRCFAIADVDGNGEIDKEELRRLLESVEGGLAYLLAWEGTFPEAKLDAIFEKYDTDKSGTITFDEFKSIVYDGLLLEGTLADYERAFRAVDGSGNGSIGATELAELFRAMGQNISQDKMVDIFTKYDVDGSGQIDFPEFIELFRDDVIDLAAINKWVSEREGAVTRIDQQGSLEDLGVLETIDGTVSLIFSEAELDEVVAKHKSRLVVLFGGVSWCRPCKGVSKAYERLADLYSSAVFLKLYGNANLQCKKLFQRLKIRSTPAYVLWRDGEVVGQGSGANKERLETLIRSHLNEAELAGKEPLYIGEEAGAPAAAN